MKALVLGIENVQFPDRQTGELIQMSRLNYIPVDADGNEQEPTSLYTRVNLSNVVPGKTYEMFFLAKKNSDGERFAGALPA